MIHSKHHPFTSHSLLQKGAIVVAAAAVVAVMQTTPVLADASNPTWKPQSSERLVKLPAQYLKKSLDADFAESELGRVLRETDDRIRLKAQTLTDLRSAIERAEGDVETELRHQFLAEKKIFIEMMSEKQGLKRRRAKTQKRVLDQLLARIQREKRGMSPARANLVQSQQAARQRFEGTVQNVDLKILESVSAQESRYAKEYAKNLAAIQQLVAAIEDHPMNRQLVGQPGLSRHDQIRLMVADAEAELALVVQEERALGYMAKLVALDAAALAEQIDITTELAEVDGPEQTTVESAVDFFVTN